MISQDNKRKHEIFPALFFNERSVDMPELTAPLVMKDDEKRIVYGPVLVPDEPDSDGDTVTAEKIEEVAHQFVEDYGNIDLQHSLNNVGKMIESYIAPNDLPIDDDTIIPKGSWLLGVRVTDDDTWQSVKDDKLCGFSIMGIEKATMKSDKANTTEKRTTLNDLGDDWLVNAVSLVDEPAVPKAKWIAVKSKGKNKDKQTEITNEMIQKAIQGSMEEREKLVRRKVYSEFDTEFTESFVHSTMQDNVIIKLVDFATDTEKLFQISYAIDDQGNVSFTSEPQEVRIEESVVPVNQQSSNNGGTSNVATNSANNNDTLLSKIKRKLGFNQSEKAGRSLSDDKLEKLKAAKEVIDELVQEGEEERSNKSKEGDDEMNKDEVQQLVQDEVNKSVEPLNNKINELTNTLKAEAKDENKDTDEAHQTEKEKDDDSSGRNENGAQNASNESEEGAEEDTVSKSEYDKVVEALEQAKKHQPFSKRLSGQDNMNEETTKSNQPDRDGFGFKIQ